MTYGEPVVDLRDPWDILQDQVAELPGNVHASDYSVELNFRFKGISETIGQLIGQTPAFDKNRLIEYLEVEVEHVADRERVKQSSLRASVNLRNIVVRLRNTAATESESASV